MGIFACFFYKDRLTWADRLGIIFSCFSYLDQERQETQSRNYQKKSSIKQFGYVALQGFGKPHYNIELSLV